MLSYICLLHLVACVVVCNSFDYKETWGYVNVRPNAHMFWWLYAKPNNNTRPLFVWLQGGPGASGTGFGNFGEIGPLHVNGSRRSTTWLNKVDLIFIDNPVGAGFSYVDDDSGYTKNIDEISADLLSWAKAFFNGHREYQDRPLYIFSESYGGKMAAAFANVLSQAIDDGKVKANLKGVALGDSWISPIDYVNTWTPYLYAFSLLGNSSQARLNKKAAECQMTVTKEKWLHAFRCWSRMANMVNELTDSVSFYNVLQKSTGQRDESLSELMNGPIRRKFKIIPEKVTWVESSRRVFNMQSHDFMKPVVDIVDKLIADDKIQVIVYNGQLDLICCTLGTERWINRLRWTALGEFHLKQRTATHLSNGQTAFFVKTLHKFTMAWVMRAGHMVPSDAPEATNMLLDYVLKQD